jgi:hypothetical protein
MVHGVNNPLSTKFMGVSNRFSLVAYLILQLNLVSKEFVISPNIIDLAHLVAHIDKCYTALH